MGAPKTVLGLILPLPLRGEKGGPMKGLIGVVIELCWMIATYAIIDSMNVALRMGVVSWFEVLIVVGVNFIPLLVAFGLLLQALDPAKRRKRR